jgi:hypothetical protein
VKKLIALQELTIWLIFVQRVGRQNIIFYGSIHMRQGPNGRRGPRRPHQGGGTNGAGGGNGGERNGNGGGSGGQGGVTRSEPRRSAASLRNQSFDSNGPEVRVRGNAWQVHEKYQTLARDAQMSGDRVAAENFFQHAEHYYRIIEAINEATAAEQTARGFGAQPDTRGAYPTPVTEGAQPPQTAEGHADAHADAHGAGTGTTTPAEQAVQQAEVIHSAPPTPFFSAEEAEADAESQPVRVASF